MMTMKTDADKLKDEGYVVQRTRECDVEVLTNGKKWIATHEGSIVICGPRDNVEAYADGMDYAFGKADEKQAREQANAVLRSSKAKR